MWRGHAYFVIFIEEKTTSMHIRMYDMTASILNYRPGVSLISWLDLIWWTADMDKVTLFQRKGQNKRSWKEEPVFDRKSWHIAADWPPSNHSDPWWESWLCFTAIHNQFLIWGLLFGLKPVFLKNVWQLNDMMSWMILWFNVDNIFMVIFWLSFGHFECLHRNYYHEIQIRVYQITPKLHDKAAHLQNCIIGKFQPPLQLQSSEIFLLFANFVQFWPYGAQLAKWGASSCDLGVIWDTLIQICFLWLINHMPFVC